MASKPTEEKSPVWREVLRTYRQNYGSGLSAQALVTITGMPWPKMRKQMVAWAKTHDDLYIYRCSTIKAHLFNYCISGSPCFDISLIDQWVKDFDPAEKWAGLDDGKGTTELHVSGGQRVLDALYRTVESYDKEDTTKRTKSS